MLSTLLRRAALCVLVGAAAVAATAASSAASAVSAAGDKPEDPSGRADGTSIFVYGDSLTFGWIYDIDTQIVSRMPRCSTWPEVMKKALQSSGRIPECCRVEVDALGGRTTDLDEPDSPGSGLIPGETYNGLRTLPAALSAHMPVDLVIVMLGANDLARHHGRNAEGVAQGLVNLVDCVRTAAWQRRTSYAAPRVLVVLPPAFDGDDTPYGDFFSGALEKSRDWARVIEPAVRAAGADFLDAAPVVGLPDQPDHVHLTIEETEKLGLAVAAKVERMLSPGKPTSEKGQR